VHHVIACLNQNPCLPARLNANDNRQAAEGGARHDFVPFASDDLRNVCAHEGRLTRLGANLAVPAERLTQKSEEQWQTATSWITLDDPEFALDPDDAWCDEAVEGDVMVEAVHTTSTSKKKSKSKSFSELYSFYLDSALILNDISW